MRLFVAIFPPAHLAEALVGSAKETLDNERLRFTPPENVHLTLKFIGDVPEVKLDGITEALVVAAEGHPPFEIEIAGLGAFPNPRRTKVLWAGVGSGSERLKALASDVERCLASLGFERESRPFIPHFTLGRAWRGVTLDLANAVVPQTKFVAKRFALVESVTGGDGVVYRLVSSFALAGLAG